MGGRLEAVEHNIHRLAADSLAVWRIVGCLRPHMDDDGRLCQTGNSSSIGVSKFDSRELAGIIKYADIKPAVNQIMYNVYHHDDDTIQFCRENNITVEAYSPLGSWNGPFHGNVFKDPRITAIAAMHNVSAAQVALKWIVQRGDVLTFMSDNESHQVNDADLLDPDFHLSDAEMLLLSNLQPTSELLI